MKFIKTADGWYIDQSKIDSFTVAKCFGTDGKGEGFAACAYICGQRWRLIEFYCDPRSTTQFDPKEAAQVWLDDFATKLHKENYND